MPKILRLLSRQRNQFIEIRYVTGNLDAIEVVRTYQRDVSIRMGQVPGRGVTSVPGLSTTRVATATLSSPRVALFLIPPTHGSSTAPTFPGSCIAAPVATHRFARRAPSRSSGSPRPGWGRCPRHRPGARSPCSAVQEIRRADLPPVCRREVHVGEDVLLGLPEHLRDLRVLGF